MAVVPPPLFGACTSIGTAFSGAQAVFAADMDGDGDLDAVYASARSNLIVAWAENTDGRGTFRSRAAFVKFDRC